MILLTDEEINKLADEQRKADGLPPNAWLDSIEPERITKAQLKKVVEWGNKLCKHGSYQLSRKAKDCPNCWQALLKEAE